MKSSIQLKYRNYAGFSYLNCYNVNNSGLEKEIDRITHDTFHLSTLYPTIYRLLKLGYIKEYSYYVTDSNRLRRYYGITEEGKKRLKHIREEYCQMVQAVSDIMADKK